MKKTQCFDGKKTMNFGESHFQKRILLIYCKGVFKTTRDEDAGITELKAGVVIKGCGQKKGIEYVNSF